MYFRTEITKEESRGEISDEAKEKKEKNITEGTE